MAKAKPMRRVKANTAWKKVKVTEDLLNSEVFDGLVDIQVLTDYDLIEENIDSDDNSKEEKKSKKRKKKEVDNIELIEDDVPLKKIKKNKLKSDIKSEETDVDNGKITKKSKKKKKKEKSSNIDTDKELIITENVETNNKKNERSKKDISDLDKSNFEVTDITQGEILTDNNVEIVTDVVNCDVPENIQIKKSKSKKNKERKKKKKLANKIKQGKPCPAVSSDSKDIKDLEGKEEAQDKDTESLDMSQWTNLYVPESIMKALTKQRFVNPTVIQSLTLPSAIRDRRDILGAAETGSGKTLAFGIPVLAKILAVKKDEVQNQTTEDVDDKLQGDISECHEDSHVECDQENEESIEDDVEIMDVEEGDDENTDEDDDDSASIDEDDDDNEKMDDDDDDDANIDKNDDPDCEENIDEEEDDDLKEQKSQEAKIDRPPMALILEPTRELAVQVKKHLMTVAEFTSIQFATVVGGMSVDKQRRILAGKPEVIIATPGRLWQLIEEDNVHLRQIDMVHCLVVDEADRMVEKGHYEELTKLLELMNNSKRRLQSRQTFVMSATLTMDISAPKRLNNKKKKVVEEDKLKSLTDRICVGFKPKVIDLTPKDKVAQTLTELRVSCKADEKDLYLYYFLCQYPGRTLVFVNSKDCLRRLISLFTLLKCSPLPLHADMHQRQRLKNLDKFSENSKALLIASDVAARGLDIPKVDHVIHYQVPRTMENYIHRSGRTARASNEGVSLMMIGPEEARDYRKIVQGVRNGEDLEVMTIEMELMPAVKSRVGLAREIDVKEYRIKKKKMKNNFFQKAAEDMDMIIDDKYLLEDLGDTVEQSEDKIQLKKMKASLTAVLQGSLRPLRMSKYPTKSGQLQQRKAVNLIQSS